VKLAYDNTIKAARIGDEKIKRDERIMAVIEGVMYVPGMKCNLLSVGQLIEKGFSVCMKNDMLKVYDSKLKQILKSPLSKSRTVQTRFNQIESHYLTATTVNKTAWLWHMRFDHLNFQSLRKLVVEEMVTSFVKDAWLENSGTPFKSHMHMRAKDVFHVVYSDFYGPFEVLSVGQNRYFVSFIDEYSRMIWLYLLKAKSDVFIIFKQFKVFAEKTEGKKVENLSNKWRGRVYIK